MRLKLFLLSVISSIICQANSTTDITCESFADDAFKGTCIEIPTYRPLRGGTKIKTTYTEDCPEELIGAFNYATKIWEENLPSMLPINITVKWERIRGSGSTNLLSKVTYKTLESETEFDKDCLSPMAQIKTIVLKELHIQTSHRYTDIIEDVSEGLDDTDITITYNSALYDDFSFHIDDIVSDKYDFVTLALRDIAKGLGLGINITAFNNSLVMPDSKKTYYENLIWNVLKNETGASAYTKCTQGSLAISCLPLLYAPKTWQNGISLQYYIPDESNTLSKLLTYDFGKGYVMRDLSGLDWNNMEYLLDWNAMVTSGSNPGSATENGSTEHTLPYKGVVDLSSEFSQNANNYVDSTKTDKIEQVSFLSTDASNYNELCNEFKYFYTGSTRLNYGYSISALLNNGKWDILYVDYYPDSFVFNMDDLKLNHPDSHYARSCSGGLRYRLTKCTQNGRYANYSVKYFTRNYTPQPATIKYSKIHNDEPSNIRSISASDDYFIDVEIGISNIEGVTKIIVEQLDEGDRVPFRYETKDFKRGYFIANLDRELSTQLTIYCYNENGMSKSNTIVIPAIGYPDTSQTINFTRNSNSIKVTGINSTKTNAIYTLTNIINSSKVKSGILNEFGEINIQDLPTGVYVLTVQSGQENSIYKFTK